jgi:hypothetical protein
VSIPKYRVAYVLSQGEPIAVFLDSSADCNSGNAMTYARAGEHCEGSIDWVRQQPLASADQYRDLHSYLVLRYADPSHRNPVELVIDQEALPR